MCPWHAARNPVWARYRLILEVANKMPTQQATVDCPFISNAARARHPWWREGEVFVLAALVFLAYFVRISDLTVRGEESRWATVALEMMRGGDWVVPRQQGEPFYSRPPLGNWLIAGATLLHGRCDAFAIRLPTVTAVLLMTLMVYAVGRTFMGRLGAFTAGLAICSMGEILQMGRVAESDAVFAFLLSAAWFVWLCGYRAPWPATATWSAAYALAALAALQKGPQAPVSFAVAITLFLCLRREKRRLLSSAHGIGFLTFVVVVGSWQFPFFISQGWEATKRIWLADSAAPISTSATARCRRSLDSLPLGRPGLYRPMVAAFIRLLQPTFSM